MTLLRQYIPAIGKQVKLRLFSDYTSLRLPPWGYLRVLAIDDQNVSVQHCPAPMDHSKDGEVISVKLNQIAAPFGWQPRYTITCKSGQVEQVLSWFARGIVVRQSHYLSTSMPVAFQPMDNAAATHWQFPEITDAVPAEECRKVFRVVKIEHESASNAYLAADPSCKVCDGTGRRRLATMAKARQTTVSNLLADEKLLASLTGWNVKTCDFTCHCTRGGFARLGRSKRAKLIKEWEQDGWRTYYHTSVGYWERERTVLVQDWEAV